jgi:CIC family chloride channel protein
VEGQNRPQAHGVVLEMMLVILIGSGIGVLMALASSYFVLGVGALTRLRQAGASHLPESLAPLATFTPLLALLLAAALVILVRRLFSITRWHGPADSILSAHQSGNTLDVRAGLGSTLAAFLSAGGGASVGQYGPLVHFGATLAALVGKLGGTKVRSDTFIGCGVAAAISAGFNAPLAGMVFAHEAILRHYSWRAIAPISIASIAASATAQHFFGGSVVFSVEPIPFALLDVMPYVLLAGPLAGLTAVAFLHSVRSIARWAPRSGLGPERNILLAALLCGLIGMAVPEILGLGTGTVNDTLDGRFALATLGILLVAKLAASALCLGLGLYGGILSPALFIGASLGAGVAAALSGLGLEVAAPVLTVAAMVAVGGAVIGAPIAAILIALEMTGSYPYAVAALLTVTLAALVSQRLFGLSYFDRQLMDRSINIQAGRQTIALQEQTVGPLVTDAYLALAADSTAEDGKAAMVRAGVTEAYVLAADRTLEGKVSLHQLLAASNDNRTLGDLMSRDMLVLPASMSLLDAMEAITDFVGESLPVCEGGIEGSPGRFLGAVSEGDLFAAYLAVSRSVFHLEHS